jgi:hypothetical protein
MKKLIILLCITFFAGPLFAQEGTVQVHEALFKQLKQGYEQSEESKMMQRLIPNAEQRQMFENDVLGIFSLSQSSFKSKIGAICDCKLKEGALKKNEVEAINEFIAAVANKNEREIENKYKSMLAIKAPSALMGEMIKTMNEGEGATTQAGGRGLWRAIGIIIGAGLGGGIGGGAGGIGAGPGAVIGGAVGKEIADEAYDWWTTPSGAGVVARPDGSDCTVPALGFPLF